MKLHTQPGAVLDFYGQDRVLYYSCQSPATVTPLKYSFRQKLKAASHRKYKPLITALYNKHKPLIALMQFTGDTKLKILNTIRVNRQHKGYPRLKCSENN